MSSEATDEASHDPRSYELVPGAPAGNCRLIRWQARPTFVGVEPLAESFDVPVEVMLIEDLIQSRVEWMRGTARDVLCATHIDAWFV